MTRISRNIMTDDYEELDAMHRVIRDMQTDLFELELSLMPGLENELIAA
jgi:hypothetical protein